MVEMKVEIPKEELPPVVVEQSSKQSFFKSLSIKRSLTES